VPSASARSPRRSPARAIEQGYEPLRAATVLVGRAVAGVAEPIDLVVMP